MQPEPQATMTAKTEETPPRVEVTFDPSCVDTDPLSVLPEIVRVTRGQDTAVEFVLKTLGGGTAASFLETGAIKWQDGRLGEAECEGCSTRLLLRTEGHAQAHREGLVRLAYHVRVEFAGRQFCSTGYPTYEEQDPVT